MRFDGQIQDVGYGGPTVAGYGIGGTTGWAPGIPAAGGLRRLQPRCLRPGAARDHHPPASIAPAAPAAASRGY